MTWKNKGIAVDIMVRELYFAVMLFYYACVYNMENYFFDK